MPQNITSYGDISPRTAAYAVAKLLTRGQALLVLERFGVRDPQPKNASRTRKYRRYLSLAPATAPLAEGVTPPGQKLRHEDITCVLEQYGDLVNLTDRVADNHEDPVLNETAKLMGEQAGETVELVRFAVLCGGSNVYYANSVASRTLVNSPLLKGDLAKIVRGFSRAKCRKVTEIISPTAMVATEPVAPAYIAVCHTDLQWDIEHLSGFTGVEKYSDPSKALPGEIGKCGEIRFLLTPMCDSYKAIGAEGTTYLSNGAAVAVPAACDVYPILIFGRDAYGIVPLQGKDAVDITVINPGTKTKEDPMGQRGVASWITDQTCVRLNELWIARYEVACTANPS
ncbi:MAG: N4-gp56 family major capsid protein [Bryobacteraceae bacterium]